MKKIIINGGGLLAVLTAIASKIYYPNLEVSLITTDKELNDNFKRKITYPLVVHSNFITDHIFEELLNVKKSKLGVNYIITKNNKCKIVNKYKKLSLRDKEKYAYKTNRIVEDCLNNKVDNFYGYLIDENVMYSIKVLFSSLNISIKDINYRNVKPHKSKLMINTKCLYSDKIIKDNTYTTYSYELVPTENHKWYMLYDLTNSDIKRYTKINIDKLLVESLIEPKVKKYNTIINMCNSFNYSDFSGHWYNIGRMATLNHDYLIHNTITEVVLLLDHLIDE